MRVLIFLLYFILLSYCSQVIANEEPYCTSMIYNDLGKVDVGAMLFNCSDRIQGANFPPSYFNTEGSEDAKPTIVNASLAFSAIIEIDNVAATFSFDFWFRIYWTDPRWKFPEEMWNKLNSAARREGLEISPYVRDRTSLTIWLPDIYIIESIATEQQAELIHMFPNGSVWWSRHLVTTLKQGAMNLKDYPMDTQKFTVSLQSFAYSTDYVLLRKFTELSTVTFNADPVSGVNYLDLDPLWTFHGYEVDQVDQSLPIFFDGQRSYSTMTVFMNFERQSFGIVYRLAFPVMMLLFIVGFAFWADISQRIDVTITMILAFSGMYLIIGQVIPFVGYYSVLDQFITTGFCILCLTAGVHYITTHLDSESYKYPLNEVFRDLIVYICRLIWVPMIFFVALYFYFSQVQIYLLPPLIITIVLTSGHTLYHTSVLGTAFRKCICRLRVKHYYREMNKPFLADCECTNMLDGEDLVVLDVTILEAIVYSLTYYHDCACDKRVREVKEKNVRNNNKKNDDDDGNIHDADLISQIYNDNNKVYPMESPDGNDVLSRPIDPSKPKKLSAKDWLLDMSRIGAYEHPIRDYPFYCQLVKEAIIKIEGNHRRNCASCENYFCVRCRPRDEDRKNEFLSTGSGRNKVESNTRMERNDIENG